MITPTDPHIYQAGETIQFWAEVKQGTAYFDPGSVNVWAYAPSGSVMINGALMSKSAVGRYYYNWLIPGTPEAGEYESIWQASTGDNLVTKRKGTFIVEVP